MPLYLTKFSYTPETWARLIDNPEDRRKAAQAYIESVGGKLHGFWYAFGAHDGYNLWEAPDNVSMAAVVLAIGGGGALSSFETTVLLTVDETMEALRKAEQVSTGRQARNGSSHAACRFKARIIQDVPNLSLSCPNRVAKNVSSRRMNTCPPSDNRAQTRSASAALSTVSER